jgi:hypothetical protein
MAKPTFGWWANLGKFDRENYGKFFRWKNLM